MRRSASSSLIGVSATGFTGRQSRQPTPRTVNGRASVSGPADSAVDGAAIVGEGVGVLGAAGG